MECASLKNWGNRDNETDSNCISHTRSDTSFRKIKSSYFDQWKFQTLPRYQSMSLLTQNVWLRRISKPLAPPILPGHACFPEYFHTNWVRFSRNMKQNSSAKSINIYLLSSGWVFLLQSSIKKEIISKINETSQARKDKQKPSSFHNVPIWNVSHCLGAEIKGIIWSVLEASVLWTLNFSTALFRATLYLPHLCLSTLLQVLLTALQVQNWFCGITPTPPHLPIGTSGALPGKGNIS